MGPARLLVLWLFRSFVGDFFLERFPDYVIADESFFIWFLLPGCVIRGYPIRNLGFWLLLAHVSPFIQNTGTAQEKQSSAEIRLETSYMVFRRRIIQVEGLRAKGFFEFVMVQVV